MAEEAGGEVKYLDAQALTRAQIDVLQQVVRADWAEKPTWDGNIICSHTGRQLLRMGLVYHAHGYWFPSYEGRQWVRWLRNTFGPKEK